VRQTLAHLHSDPNGLSDEDAARRLQRVGPNRLTPPAPVSALKILADQLRSVVVLLLIAAGAISLLLGDRIEAAAIGGRARHQHGTRLRR
jgi:Ca2+-transporting ATPase